MGALEGIVLAYFIVIPISLAFLAGYYLGEKLTKLELKREAPP